MTAQSRDLVSSPHASHSPGLTEVHTLFQAVASLPPSPHSTHMHSLHISQ